MNVEHVHKNTDFGQLSPIKITFLGNLADKDDFAVGRRNDCSWIVRGKPLWITEKVDCKQSQAKTGQGQNIPVECGKKQGKESERNDKGITFDSYWLMPITHCMSQ